jgi:hypothetical protein
MSTSHPDRLLEEFLSKNPRPQKVKNLQAIHELCKRQHKIGSRDFSLATIGKLCEKQGILKARGLYNGPLADYRTLIEAWAAYSGPVLSKPEREVGAEEYLSRIEDPAVRILVQSVFAERNKLRGQLNTLKAATKIVVDRRHTQIGDSNSSNLKENGLTPSERIALERAVSDEFYNEHGWEEVELGEIVNSRGRTIFDPGFATGLRKLLSVKKS